LPTAASMNNCNGTPIRRTDSPTRRRLWACAEKKVPDLFFGIRYPENKSGTFFRIRTPRRLHCRLLQWFY
ncbi:MAG: hypothetical protein L0Y45_09880, partial [Woeseiaceae bacterium]|nr:hypothetical protein [Woeseiaceae bacterium]